MRNAHHVCDKSPISTQFGPGCLIFWTRLVEFTGWLRLAFVLAGWLMARVASTKPLLGRACWVTAQFILSFYIAQGIEAVVVKFPAHFSCAWKSRF